MVHRNSNPNFDCYSWVWSDFGNEEVLASSKRTQRNYSQKDRSFHILSISKLSFYFHLYLLVCLKILSWADEKSTEINHVSAIFDKILSTTLLFIAYVHYVTVPSRSIWWWLIFFLFVCKPHECIYLPFLLSRTSHTWILTCLALHGQNGHVYLMLANKYDHDYHKMLLFCNFAWNPVTVSTYHSYWAGLHTLRYCHVPPPSVTHFDLRGQIHPHARCYPRKSIQNIRILRITYHL